MKKYPIRKTIRLKNYDYKTKAYYYVTIVTKDRAHILSNIAEKKISLSPIGQIIDQSIQYLQNNKAHIPEYIIMPNHIHMIIGNLKLKASLFDIMRNFKSHTARLVSNKYHIRLWQRSYYEIIIRSQTQYDALAKYILENPIKWSLDKYNDL